MLLGVGQYGFQFEFPIGYHLPGSFEGDHEEVRYVVYAVIKRPLIVEDRSNMVPVTVRALFSLESVPEDMKVDPVHLISTYNGDSSYEFSR